MLFGKLKAGGTVRVVVTTDESGVKSLDFVYPEGPVLPRPEREFVEAGRKRAKGRTRPDEDDEAEDDPDTPTEPGTGGTVPKVPLKL